MSSTIPFEIPAELLGRVASGELVRYGTILKNAGTGQIVRHLQETGMVQSILSNLSSGPFSALQMLTDVVGAGANVYAGIKIDQLKVMMETLEALQMATLGVSVVGIGVSAAGFYYMNKRFNVLENRMDELAEAIKVGFESQGHRDLRQQLHITKSLLQRAQQAPALSDPKPEYSQVAAGLTNQAAYFSGEIAFAVKTKSHIDLDLFQQLAQMLMLCNSVRIDCGIRTNELKHALTVSESVASDYENLFMNLTPLSFGPDGAKGLSVVRVLRDASDAASSKPYLIDFLRTRRIDGGEYIQSLEKEKNSPYLLLNTSR